MSGTEHKRPWLAALLGLVPGLGHVYLREWLRAFSWVALVVLTGWIMVPPSVMPTEFALGSLRRAARQYPTDAMLALTVVTAMNMIDAYRIAEGNNRRIDREVAGTACPNCGRDVDPDLDFCHWCTSEIPIENGERDDAET